MLSTLMKLQKDMERTTTGDEAPTESSEEEGKHRETTL